MKYMTDKQLTAVEKKYFRIEKQIRALKREQDKLEDVLERHGSKVEDQWCWLDSRADDRIITKKQKAELKEVNRVLNRIDRIQDKMWHQN